MNGFKVFARDKQLLLFYDFYLRALFRDRTFSMNIYDTNLHVLLASSQPRVVSYALLLKGTLYPQPSLVVCTKTAAVGG